MREIQSQRSSSKDPDSRPEIFDQGLGFLLHIVWTFLTQMIIALWTYLSKSNVNIDNETFGWKASFL